ncbi:G-protein coupled receptor-associated protein LMBRD2 [Pelomyxa schiedti]|nr:G-protein coupled receptor-associated protein LMBRD2 [Pelomyxa schiedti]
MVSLWWLVFFELGALGVFVFFLLRRYVAWKRTPGYAFWLTFLGWFLAMGIAVMLPIDISSTSYETCLAENNLSSTSAEKATTCDELMETSTDSYEPLSTSLSGSSSTSYSSSPSTSNSISTSSSYSSSTSTSTSTSGSISTSVSKSSSHSSSPSGTSESSDDKEHSPCFDLLYMRKEVLVVCWNLLYWTTFILCWFVFPVMQSYSTVGEFSFFAKLRTAIKENILFYVVGGAVLGIFLIIFIALSRDGNWFGVAMSCSNAYGLILYLLLLSYGLVLLPRKLWRKGKLETRLRYCQFHAVNLHRDALSYREQYAKTLQQIKKYDETLEELDPLRDYVNIIVKKCPAEYMQVRPEGDSHISYSTVVKLHHNLMEYQHLSTQSQALYNQILETAFYLEDILNSKGRPEHEIRWSFRSKFPRFLAVMEYMWCCYVKPRTLQVAGVILALLSCIVVFSEVTFRWDDPTLSVFALMIRPEVVRLSSILLIVVLIGPLFYLIIATYSAFFALRFFNYYRLIPNQLSSANSIMFSAAYLCRLGPPLAFNFLYVIKFHDTAFEEVMSYMSDVPFFGGDKFLNNIPWMLVPLCLICAFDIGPRIVRLMPCKRLTRYVYDDYDETQIDEGEQIIHAERVVKERLISAGESVSHLTVDTTKDEEAGINMGALQVPIKRTSTILNQESVNPEQPSKPKLSSSSTSPPSTASSISSQPTPIPQQHATTEDPESGAAAGGPTPRFKWFRLSSEKHKRKSSDPLQTQPQPAVPTEAGRIFTVTKQVGPGSSFRDLPPLTTPPAPINANSITRTTPTPTAPHNKYTNL